jgi:hypothetical protein
MADLKKSTLPLMSKPPYMNLTPSKKNGAGNILIGLYTANANKKVDHSADKKLSH